MDSLKALRVDRANLNIARCYGNHVGRCTGSVAALGAVTFGAGNGCAGITRSGDGAHAVQSNVTISGRLSSRKTDLIRIVSVLCLGHVNGLLMMQRLLGDDLRSLLRVLELRRLHTKRISIGRRARLKMPARERERRHAQIGPETPQEGHQKRKDRSHSQCPTSAAKITGKTQ